MKVGNDPGFSFLITLSEDALGAISTPVLSTQVRYNVDLASTTFLPAVSLWFHSI